MQETLRYLEHLFFHSFDPAVQQKHQRVQQQSSPPLTSLSETRLSTTT